MLGSVGNFNSNISRTTFCRGRSVEESSVSLHSNDTLQLTSSGKNKTISKNAIGWGCILGGVAILGALFCKIGGLKSIMAKFSGVAKTKSVSSQAYVNGIESIQANFSKIFGRNISKEEANQLALRYREIFRNEDNARFMGELFEQLKKDYKLPEMRYYLSPLGSRLNSAEFSFFRGMTYNLNNITMHMEGNVAKITSIDRANVAAATAHELKHAQQYAIMFGTDLKKSIKALAEREQTHNSEFFKQAMLRCNNNRAAALRECEQKLYDGMLDGFKNVEQIPINTPLYKKGLQYIESNRNYISANDNYSRYRSQLIEAEAFDAGESFLDIYKLLTRS